jgi:RimJ/RimL family protein N-acetyltransferase
VTAALLGSPRIVSGSDNGIEARDERVMKTHAPTIVTERLTIRPWRLDDAQAALETYGHPAVARWLSPAMNRVHDLAAMRLLLQQWIAEDIRLVSPGGRWAIERTDDQRVIGGADLLPLPPGDEDMEIGWQLTPTAWGNGYASETTFALASWAFGEGLGELFAVVRPENTRAAATVRQNGMQWVGETTKYFGLGLQVFRLRPADLDRAAPAGQQPPQYI